MKTLHLRDGDLEIGQHGYEMISGPGRVVQDLRCHLLEPLGNDRFHPGFGSSLDDMIGVVLDDDSLLQVQQEVNRVVSNYAAIQRDKMEQDALSGDRSRYTTGEVIAEVSNVSVRQHRDSLLVDITLVTLSGETVSVTSEVAG